MGPVSHVETDELADRYGTASPRRRRLVIAVSGVIGVVALAWVVWAAWIEGTPDVQSSLRSFEVVDPHSTSAVVVVKPRSRDVSASCLVRAYGADHTVVGELNFKVARQSDAVRRTVDVRTEREATSVELIGCTTAGQSRPR
ncbi:MAG: hypothetical protein JWR90_2754 [Marmoricola sp.]|nr:hypothetical protein [Marmoricola sp.]